MIHAAAVALVHEHDVHARGQTVPRNSQHVFRFARSLQPVHRNQTSGRFSGPSANDSGRAPECRARLRSGDPRRLAGECGGAEGKRQGFARVRHAARDGAGNRPERTKMGGAHCRRWMGMDSGLPAQLAKFPPIDCNMRSSPARWSDPHADLRVRLPGMPS